jgi:hypothetical protein
VVNTYHKSDLTTLGLNAYSGREEIMMEAIRKIKENRVFRIGIRLVKWAFILLY